MADISKIILPNNDEYDIKDTDALHIAEYHNSSSNNTGKYYKVTILSDIYYMVKIGVLIYHGYQSFDLDISGYHYGSNHWFMPRVVVNGSTSTSAVTVSFGYDSNDRIWFAIPASSYTGLKVYLKANGYQQLSSDKDLFQIELVSELSENVQTIATAYRPWYRNEEVAKAADASTVNNHTVLTDVPANAVFTDTTYDAATNAPNMDGTSSVGTSVKYAREDHVHPSDTSRVPINNNNTVYTAVKSEYYGGNAPKYWRIRIPSAKTKWTVISVHVSLVQNYATSNAGTLIINAYHNSTSPYTWTNIRTSMTGLITSTAQVYGSDGEYFYIDGCGNYSTLSVDRILVGDQARGVDISDVEIDRVAELPETYQTSKMVYGFYINDYENGSRVSFAYGKAGLSSASWLAAWNGYELRAISPSNITAGKATKDGSGNTITSYYAPKSTAVTNVALSTNKITKTINGTTTDVVTAATTSAYGITKLSTATNSTATDVAATPSAVKTAYDLADTANGTANSALSGVNGNLIYDHTFTISNGVATFTPHVYQKGAEVTTNYAASCFTWKYRLIDGSEVTLTTKNDRGCDVTIANLGYGGHVIGIFTPA